MELLTRANVGTVLAVAGVVVYTVLRIAYGHFYGRFGLSPDDLGVGYADLLTQSALLGVIAMIYLSALAGFLMLIGWKLPVRWSAEDMSYGRTRVLTVVVLAASVVLVVLSWPQRHLVIGAVFAGIWLLFAAAAVYHVRAVAWARLRRRRTAAQAEAGQRAPAQTDGATGAQEKFGGSAIVAAAAALSAVVVGASWLFASAAHDADEVIAGRSLSPSRWLGVRTTSWSAEAATFSWTANHVDPALRPLTRSCVMVLGQAGGTLFVYSPNAYPETSDQALDRTTFRVPAAAAGVRVFPGGHCRKGTPIPARPLVAP